MLLMSAYRLRGCPTDSNIICVGEITYSPWPWPAGLQTGLGPAEHAPKVTRLDPLVGRDFDFAHGCPALDRNRSFSPPGPIGSSAAMSVARHTAKGRLAGQICNVETCACRTFFSYTLSSDACVSGRATPMRRGSSPMLFTPCVVHHALRYTTTSTPSVHFITSPTGTSCGNAAQVSCGSAW